MKQDISIALLKKDLTYLREGVDDIKIKFDSLDSKYVDKVEFKLVNQDQSKRIGQIEKLVFGAIGLALITLGKAVLDLVIVTKAGS